MDNKIPSIILIAVIGVILTVSVIVPVIDSASTAYTETYTNGPESSTINYATYSTDAEFEISAIKDGDAWNITGIDVNPISTGAYMLSDNILVILSTVNGYSIKGLNDSQQFVSITSADWNGVTTAVTSLTISVTSDSIVVADANAVQTSYTFPKEYVVYSDNDGERIISTGTTNVYTAGGTDIISVGINNSKFFWCTNGEDSKGVYNATLLDSSINCPLTEVSEDIDQISVGVGGDYTVSVTYNNTTYDLAPQYVSVPKTLVQGSEVNSSFLPMLGVIPLIVIVGIILAVIGSIISRNE